jgi:F0F1-type ATP synthase delta subunit
MSSIPAEISTRWHDLLKHRVLLHQTKKAVDDFDEFAKLFESPRLDDQNRAAALESYASRTFNLVIDLTKALSRRGLRTILRSSRQWTPETC